MAKINIKSALNNKSQNKKNICNTIGIKKENKIIYYDEEKKVTIETFDNNIVMYRFIDDSNYIYIMFNKDEPVCKYYMNNNHMDLDIIINKIIINENKILIDYIINEENLIFNFEYESVIK